MEITLKNRKLRNTLLFVTAETKNKKLIFIAQAATWNKQTGGNDYAEITIQPKEFSAWYEKKTAQGWKLTQEY